MTLNNNFFNVPQLPSFRVQTAREFGGTISGEKPRVAWDEKRNAWVLKQKGEIYGEEGKFKPTRFVTVAVREGDEWQRLSDREIEEQLLPEEIERGGDKGGGQAEAGSQAQPDVSAPSIEPELDINAQLDEIRTQNSEFRSAVEKYNQQIREAVNKNADVLFNITGRNNLAVRYDPLTGHIQVVDNSLLEETDDSQNEDQYFLNYGLIHNGTEIITVNFSTAQKSADDLWIEIPYTATSWGAITVHTTGFVATPQPDDTEYWRIKAGGYILQKSDIHIPQL
jgi:hypothetical protein